MKQYSNSGKNPSFEILFDIARLLYAREHLYEGNFHSNLHTHSYAEIFYITQGIGTFLFETNSCSVKEGDLLIINAHVPHTEISNLEKPLGYIVLGVRGIEALSLTESNGDFILLKMDQNKEQIFPILKDMVFEASREDDKSSEICDTLLRVVLLKLLRKIHFSTEPNESFCDKTSKECAAIKRYIDTHHKENITLDDLSKHAHISKYYMIHAFKKEYGISPIRYLQFRRIAESKLLLEETRMSAGQIAQILGFSSASQFSQCFKRLTTLSPSEFRRLATKKTQ